MAERRHYESARELADASNGVGEASRGALFRPASLNVRSDGTCVALVMVLTVGSCFMKRFSVVSSLMH